MEKKKSNTTYFKRFLPINVAKSLIFIFPIKFLYEFESGSDFGLDSELGFNPGPEFVFSHTVIG